ncbi:hypothetical protein BC829DRAFT_172245 [Chytridium lagenaria]|nr:hypothetical protein BC829DRAFT_172245 [Chytridium lagenaria]
MVLHLRRSKPAIYGELTKPLSPELSRALHDACGIKQLYSHQAEAINEIEAGSHVVVATSTSSGKSLIYQIPVIRALEADRNSRALFIFPTKVCYRLKLRLQHIFL